MAVVLATKIAAADPNAPEKKATTNEKETSSVAAAEKRSETTLIEVAPVGRDELASRVDSVGPTLVMREGSVGTTKSGANTSAGEQRTVEAPKSQGTTAKEAPAPGVLRSVSTALPRLRTCVAKDRKTLSITLSIDAAGKLTAMLPEGDGTKEEGECVKRVLQTVKVRGSRGTVSNVILPLQ